MGYWHIAFASYSNYLVKREFSSMSELAKSLRLLAQRHELLTLQLVF